MTVSPIADYEPLVLAPCPPRQPRRLPRTGARAAAPVRPASSMRARAAAAFADAALRAVLEVIDRRRAPGGLRPLLAPGLADAVIAFARGTPGHSGVLRRVRLQPVDDDETAFEVAASYTRGTRTHALACRIEPADGPGARWRVAALHIG